MARALGPERRLLAVYTGGTIGMRSERGVLVPGRGLAAVLRTLPMFHDEEHARACGLPEDTLVLPPASPDQRVIYTVLECQPLFDSSDMTITEWVQIAQTIERHYEQYHGFVVIHGTDTMAFAASVLSFVLENLQKTVVLTGAQVPIHALWNDGRENLLGALLMAGQYVIPEVCLFFQNQLFRGNRVTKVDSRRFAAFCSPNLPPLAVVGTDVLINRELVRKARGKDRLVVHSSMERDVGLLRLYPGIPAALVRAFLQPPMKGVVMETFGSGNGPTQPELLGELQAAAQRGLLILNCTHCLQGAVTSDYAAGMVGAGSGARGGEGMGPETLHPFPARTPLPTGHGGRRHHLRLRHDVGGGAGQAVLCAGPAGAEPGRQEGGARCWAVGVGTRVRGLQGMAGVRLRQTVGPASPAACVHGLEGGQGCRASPGARGPPPPLASPKPRLPVLPLSRGALVRLGLRLLTLLPGYPLSPHPSPGALRRRQPGRGHRTLGRPKLVEWTGLGLGSGRRVGSFGPRAALPACPGVPGQQLGLGSGAADTPDPRSPPPAAGPGPARGDDAAHGPRAPALPELQHAGPGGCPAPRSEPGTAQWGAGVLAGRARHQPSPVSFQCEQKSTVWPGSGPWRVGLRGFRRGAARGRGPDGLAESSQHVDAGKMWPHPRWAIARGRACRLPVRAHVPGSWVLEGGEPPAGSSRTCRAAWPWDAPFTFPARALLQGEASGPGTAARCLPGSRHAWPFPPARHGQLQSCLRPLAAGTGRGQTGWDVCGPLLGRLCRPGPGCWAERGLGHAWDCPRGPPLGFPALWPQGSSQTPQRIPGMGWAAHRSSARGVVPFFPGGGTEHPVPRSPTLGACCDCLSVPNDGLRGWVACPGHTAGKDGAGWWPHVPRGRC
uniref:asparaginase n=1 Tax=Canis lupus familiaris TaxID=9615 RepID=A0A8C0SKV8_CANLF